MADQSQAELGDEGGENRQWPVQQQGHCSQADKVHGQAGVEVPSNQPEQEYRQHCAAYQVLAAGIAEQLDPGRSHAGPKEPCCVEQPAQKPTGRREQFGGNHPGFSSSRIVSDGWRSITVQLRPMPQRLVRGNKRCMAWMTSIGGADRTAGGSFGLARVERSEEHTSELQSREKLVCRLLL